MECKNWLYLFVFLRQEQDFYILMERKLREWESSNSYKKV